MKCEEVVENGMSEKGEDGGWWRVGGWWVEEWEKRRTYKCLTMYSPHNDSDTKLLCPLTKT